MGILMRSICVAMTGVIKFLTFLSFVRISANFLAHVIAAEAQIVASRWCGRHHHHHHAVAMQDEGVLPWH